MVFASGDSRWRHIDQRALQVVIMVLEAIIAHGWHASRCSLPLVSVGVFTGLFVPLVPDPPWTTPVCLVVTFLGEAIELVTLPAIANAQVLLGWVTTHVACTRCTNGDLAYHAMDRGLVESTHSTSRGAGMQRRGRTRRTSSITGQHHRSQVTMTTKCVGRAMALTTTRGSLTITLALPLRRWLRTMSPAQTSGKDMSSGFCGRAWALETRCRSWTRQTEVAMESG
eukprot:COSAG01_NODE_361_length_18141_cov_34.624619_5_plen_226_part_00